MSDVIIIDEPDDSISIIDLVPEVVTVTESGNNTSVVEVLEEASVVTVVTEKSPDLLMVTSGGSVYQTAVDEGFVGTELEWLSGLFEEYAKVSYVVGAIKTSEDATAYVIQELTAEFANSYVNNQSFDLVIANEREAIAISLAALNSKFEDDIAATTSQLNTTIANGDFALAERITLTQANLENNYATILVLNQAIATEQQARALALSELSVNFENRLNASVNDLTEVIADESSARAAAITQLSADYFAGIEAAITQINQVSADIEGSTEAISSLEGAVFNSFTGLSASYTLAQSAKTSADGNASAIAGMRVAVAGTNNQSAAELQLTATVNKANESFARAFLGVTSTVGGVAKITGITVNGANNALDFAGDIFRLSNTAGAVQLYWSAGTGKWTFTGDIVAGTFQTATSGVRAEMSGAGLYPFWFGSGVKNWANANFAVDINGNVKANNIALTNATLSGSLQAATGTFAGDISAASGTFNGVVNVVRGSKRLRLDPSSSIPFWFGENSIPVGSQTRDNANFWIDSNGKYPAPQKSRALAEVNASVSSAFSISLNHKTAKGVCDIFVGIPNCSLSREWSSTTVVTYNLLKNGVSLKSFSKTIETGPSGGGFPILPPITLGSYSLNIADNNEGLAYGTAINYTFVISVSTTAGKTASLSSGIFAEELFIKSEESTTVPY